MRRAQAARQHPEAILAGLLLVLAGALAWVGLS